MLLELPAFKQATCDVHKRILEVPLPRFSAQDARHAALAEIGRQSAAQAALWAAREVDPATLYGPKLGRARLDLREYLREEMRAADRLLDQILSDG